MSPTEPRPEVGDHTEYESPADRALVARLDLVALADIAARYADDVTYGSLKRHHARPPKSRQTMPTPAAYVAGRPLYLGGEIAAWAEARGWKRVG